MSAHRNVNRLLEDLVSKDFKFLSFLPHKFALWSIYFTIITFGIQIQKLCNVTKLSPSTEEKKTTWANKFLLNIVQ
jgi:hypothetical protein